MDEKLIALLRSLGYRETSYRSECGEVVKATYVNDEGHSVDLYNKIYMNAFVDPSSPRD